MRYAVYPRIGCGTCAVLREGRELLCLTRARSVRGPPWYAPRRCPHARYLSIRNGTAGLSPRRHLLGLTAFSALKKIRDHVDVGDHFLIIGAGGVGGQAVHIAPAYLGGKMLVADIDGQKRAHASEIGAAGTVDNSAADALQQVLQQSGGGVAGAIDFVGSPKTMEFGINALRKGGKLVMVGLYGGAASVSTVLFPFKMMSIEGSYVGTLQDLKRCSGSARRQVRRSPSDAERSAPRSRRPESAARSAAGA